MAFMISVHSKHVHIFILCLTCLFMVALKEWVILLLSCEQKELTWEIPFVQSNVCVFSVLVMVQNFRQGTLC